MSEIPRPSVTEYQLPSKPDYEPGSDGERHVLNRRKLAVIIGAGAAFATLVTGAVIGLNSKETHAIIEPGQQEPQPPIASSSPEQNEPSPSISSQSPSPETTPSQPEIAKEDFVYSLEGKTFSYKDFINAIEVPYEKNQKGGDVMRQFVSRLNKMVRSGTAKNDRDSYDQYWSSEANANGHHAVASDFYAPAYKEALFTNSIEGHAVISSGNLLDRVSKVHHENINGFDQTRDEAQPYMSQYAISFDGLAHNATMLKRNDGGKDLSFFSKLTLTDNGDKNTYGSHRESFGSNYADPVEKIQESYIFNGLLYGDPEEGTWKLVEGNLNSTNTDME